MRVNNIFDIDITSVLNESNIDFADQRTMDEDASEESEKFNTIEFEKSIPHSMRFKECNNVENNGLYWVTQEPFSLEELNQFAEAFKNTGFDKAYVTVRDLSNYSFEDDLKRNVLAIVDKDGSINSDGYWAAAKQWLEDDSETINENFGDTTDYTNKIESLVKEYWKQLEDKKLFDAIADIETEVETTNDEFKKPLAYNVDIATMRKGLNDRADEIGAYVEDKIPAIEYKGYKDTKILDSDFGSDVTLRFTQNQEMPDFGAEFDESNSSKLKEDENPERFGSYESGDLVQVQDVYSGQYYGKFKVIGKLDPDKSKEKFGDAVVGYELEVIEPSMFKGEITDSNNYRMKPYKEVSITEDADAKLDDDTMGKVNDLISRIHNLQDTIKHTVQDEMISINARIEELNKVVKYSVEELDTENPYYNTSDVLGDLEYLIKESDWAEEDEAENESENITEATPGLHGPDSPEIKAINNKIDKEYGSEDEMKDMYAQDKNISNAIKDPDFKNKLIAKYKEDPEFRELMKELIGEPQEGSDLDKAMKESDSIDDNISSALNYLKDIIETIDIEGSIDTDSLLLNVKSAMDILDAPAFDDILDQLQSIENIIAEEGSIDNEKAYGIIEKCISKLKGETEPTEIDIKGFDKGEELERLHSNESENIDEDVLGNNLPKVGDKFKNSNGTIIVVIDPTNDGKPQFNIATSEENYNNGKYECRDTNSYESLDRILKHNMYSKVEE